MLAGPFPSRVTLCKAFHLSMARFTFGGEQQEASGSIPGSRNINDEKNALLYRYFRKILENYLIYVQPFEHSWHAVSFC